jgi:leucyl aminopeptidase (aminopeptidase T)
MTEEPRPESRMRASAELVADTRFEVKEGDAVTVAGAEARRLPDVITGVPGTETVAEFASGTSDFAPVGDPSENGRKGTVHFALGNQNCYPGAQNRRMLHLDRVCHNVSLQILDTGEYIVKDGIWLL